jgi:hypothetical protein
VFGVDAFGEGVLGRVLAFGQRDCEARVDAFEFAGRGGVDVAKENVAGRAVSERRRRTVVGLDALDGGLAGLARADAVLRPGGYGAEQTEGEKKRKNPTPIRSGEPGGREDR